MSLDGPGFDDAIQIDHSGATVEVARAFPALGAQLTPNIKLGADLVKARSKLAGKASEPLCCKVLGTRFGTYGGRAVEPKYRSHRSNWHHGLPAGIAMLA